MKTRTITYKELHENGFYHEWLKDDDNSIVAKIDKLIGGWPVSGTHLKFYHGDKDNGRVMCFFNDAYNTEWWTVVMSKERYLELKKTVQIKIETPTLN